ncbi:Fic family protein [Fulvivirgaceae bacterium BMA12]|uniref:Fic family protein n=1 Tax=Agaribacillus aureus TaxID=3051825 RepID=A0ABT8L0H9_9BACT|nr:Fic family protein [Fulvivirgaceae bacterium BMA12]
MQKAGNLWLQDFFKLNNFSFTHNSYIGSNDTIELTANGNVNQVYGPRYASDKDTPFEHLVFSLKYDDLDLAFLKAVFEKIQIRDIEGFVASSPTGKYARRIGYLFEFLTEQQLNFSLPASLRYVDLIEEDKYITGKPVKNPRWKVNDNLLGTNQFCPIIRKTPALNEFLKWDIPKAIEELKKEYSEDIFRRATNYLYKKETRSSYEIEHEKPSPDRMERFIALLEKAGRESDSKVLDEGNLTFLQNTIVDPRFAASGFRDFQNYIGQSLPDFTELIHYICPPPLYLSSLMRGLKESSEKSEGTSSVIRATILSFGFVFHHPFEDGNGRIHRFLIHDTLVRDGTVPEGLIIPVSAYMLNNMKEYDTALENFSKPIMKVAQYKRKGNEELKVTNPDEIEAYYRYPDLTAQSIFLAQTIRETITWEMPHELRFIQRYDELKSTIQSIVDMPDKYINLMVLFLHQNKGILPKRRRKKFNKLTDHEISQIEQAYRETFEVSK